MKSVRKAIKEFNERAKGDYYLYIITASKGNIYFGIIDNLSGCHTRHIVNSIDEFFTWFIEWAND